jgi:hypothetical protein
MQTRNAPTSEEDDDDGDIPVRHPVPCRRVVLEVGGEPGDRGDDAKKCEDVKVSGMEVLEENGRYGLGDLCVWMGG